MYGETATGLEHAMNLLQSLVQNPPLLRRRAVAGLDILINHPNVDSSRLAAVGFCFGGGVVLELARLAAGLSSVVAFHPGLTGLPDRDERKITCRIMVCAGADDPLIPTQAREKFIELMNACGADWQMLVYGGAGHSFTDRSIDALGMRGFSYHAPSDRRSWAAMRDFFEETLGEVGDGGLHTDS
jgi:dienelactone hydrolase